VDNVAWKEANDDLDAGIKTAPLNKVFFQGVFFGYGNMDLLRNNMENDWSRA